MMERLSRRFRALASRENGGRARRGWRYSQDLRELALECLAAGRAAGMGAGRVAGELGLTVMTLSAWEQQARGGFRQVLISEEKVDGGQRLVVVVSPSGYRVEGVSLAEATELLRQLG